MKKIILFLAVAALGFTSCSDDDDNNNQNPTYVTGGTVSMKINGVLKTYNTISIDRELYESDAMLFVTASQNGSSSEMATFYISENSNGANAVHNFVYVTNSEQNSQFLNFSSNVLVNTNHVVKATFSGSLVTDYDEVAGEYITDSFTDGVIDITYE